MTNLMKNAIAGGAPMAHLPRTSKINIKGVFGMGTNDAGYRVQVYDKNGKQVWICPYYQKWKGMLERCYSPVFHKKRPTYRNCTACDDWLLFSNFRKWMVKQDWEGMDLDKDIIGLDRQYSPANCRFISQDLNKLLTDHASARGKYPQGVTIVKQSGKCRARININGKQKHLGTFLTIQEASAAYVKAKRQYILDCAYNQDDVALRDGLIRHANDLTNDKDSAKIVLT